MTGEIAELILEMRDKISVLKSIAKNEPGLASKANYEIEVYEQKLNDLQSNNIKDFDIANKNCQT